MKLYDTLTGDRSEFSPQGDIVRMYVCGVTPYAPAHVGHAMSYIVFDVLRRYLERTGLAVRHVQNFTDIDDKLIDRAKEDGISVHDLAEQRISEYFEDMESLNVRNADAYPRATQEIPKIIEMIQGLIQKGAAYPAGGDVYFRVRTDRSYGKLSRRTLDKMRAGSRVDRNVAKEHPMDFVLWKSAKAEEPCWESPWGYGRPGWHIECSAMALAYLGETVDIHGGGQDLVFPHHENEIAQSEAYTGVAPFARYWVHNGLLHLDQEKMSKSLGNLVTIREALALYSSDALRLSVLNAHYRGPGYYSEESLQGAERAASRLRQALSAPANAESLDELDTRDCTKAFFAAMDDDLNTPQALAAIFELARDINRASAGTVNVVDAQRTLTDLGSGVLGLTFESLARTIDPELKNEVEALIARRDQARQAKDFVTADSVRDRLAALGVTLTDTATGTLWSLAE